MVKCKRACGAQLPIPQRTQRTYATKTVQPAWAVNILGRATLPAHFHPLQPHTPIHDFVIVQALRYTPQKMPSKEDGVSSAH